MSTKVVTIDLGQREYDIYIGNDILHRIQDFVPMDIQGRNVFIITDENVVPYANKVEHTLKAHGVRSCKQFVVKPGEQSKSFASYQSACEWLLQNRIERKSIIFAVGGGVVGDLAGFCAASVLRGVSFVQIPTTLLAQVDSSVGGKTGINTVQGKNLVGAFYQPDAVIADIQTLETLPRRELLAGYAEVVKYGLIGNLEFYEWLEKNGKNLCELDLQAISHAVELSTKAKAEVVQADERESGVRALLNLGHTFGHALEAAAGYDGRLLHGEGVAIGTMMAMDLSARMNLMDRENVTRVEEHFIEVGLPTRASFITPALKSGPKDLLNLMRNDKKVNDDKINFILLNRIGEAFMSDEASLDMVQEVLKDSLDADNTGSNDMVKGRWKSAFSSLLAQS